MKEWKNWTEALSRNLESKSFDASRYHEQRSKTCRAPTSFFRTICPAYRSKSVVHLAGTARWAATLDNSWIHGRYFSRGRNIG